jgi:hypothetical protein
MAKIKGVIVGETKMALGLEVIEDDHFQLIGKNIWFPKSQILLEEKEVNIVASKWIYGKKVEAEKVKAAEAKEKK